MYRPIYLIKIAFQQQGVELILPVIRFCCDCSFNRGKVKPIGLIFMNQK